MITIRLDGQEAVFARFRELDDRLKNQVVRRLADAVFDDVQQGADRHTKTGALARSVQIRSFRSGYEVFHNLQHAPYAPFVHWGTRPHVIRPKDKKALRWANNGRFVFAKFVNHPGYAGDDYMVKAVQDAPRHFDRIIQALRV